MITVEDRVLRFERAKSSFYQNILPSDNKHLSTPPYPPHGYPQPGPLSFHQKPDDPDVPFGSSAEGAAVLMSQILTSLPDEAVQYASLSEHRVLVTGLDCETVTLRKLLRRFQKHGHIVDIELYRRPEMAASIAVVSYASGEAVMRSIEAENDTDWLGQRIRVILAAEMGSGPIAAASPPVHLAPDAYFYGPEWYVPGSVPLDHASHPSHSQQLYPYFY
jgi:hypothetical protein